MEARNQGKGLSEGHFSTGLCEYGRSDALMSRRPGIFFLALNCRIAPNPPKRRRPVRAKTIGDALVLIS